MQQPILIIGAGLGGLAFAQGLKKSGINFKIFERDSTHRSQGYRIRLHGEGLVGLRSILTDDVWALFEQTCPETKLGIGPQIDALTGEIKPAQSFVGGGPPGGPPGGSPGGLPRGGPLSIQNGQKPYTVDRGVMREVLLTGLEKNITYGKVYKNFTLTSSGVIAEFSDGSTESGALLVGADGVRSAVRKQYLPQMKILDLGGHLIYGKTPLTPEFESKMLPQAMDKMAGVRDQKLGTVTLMEAVRFAPKDQRPEKPELPEDYVYWVMALSGTDPPVKEEELKGLTNEQSTEMANRMTEHWYSSLRPLFDYQDPSQTGVFRLLSSAAEIAPWESDARVTLIGDAAHTMLPAAASGAVTAMRDAALLTKTISEEGVTKESIGSYEQEMRKYAGDTVALSASIGQKSFGQRPLDECGVADL